MPARCLVTTSVLLATIAAMGMDAPQLQGRDAAMYELRQDHPRLRIFEKDGRIHKLVDRQLASGETPRASADAFLNTWAPALGVKADDFIERGPFPDGHDVQGIMYQPQSGDYKFTGVYWTQAADGMPVWGTRLQALVRNVPGFPVVHATSDLRDVTGFIAPGRVAANDAMALISAAQRLGRDVSVGEVELMVFAGTSEQPHAPRAALVFDAQVGSPADPATHEKLLLIADAMTGAILHEESRILHDIAGSVQGNATEWSGADVCEEESYAPLPYIKVTGGGSTAYTDADGNFVLPYEGSGNVTLTSYLEGTWFNVNNQSGSDSSTSETGSPPGPVNLYHNEANSSEYYRAEVNCYLESNIVRDYVLGFNPTFPTIWNEENFPVNVNINDSCNAYYDYESINFYRAGGGCSNTGFSVVVHHEYGHHLVAVGGSGQGAYGEGMGDVMGVLITGDPELARGFYADDCANGIRTADNDLQYPCGGAIHYCGQLISGCVWDIRELMMDAYPDEGEDIIGSLAVNAILLHGGSSIDPSITLDYLTLDDDDGDLDNGTPHDDEILGGMAMHNMDELPEPLDNDFCSTARVIADGDWSFTTIGALSDGDPYDDAQCSGTYLGEMYADVWFSWTACNGSGATIVSTCDLIDFDSDIVVYQGTCENMTQVACNGDGSGCGGYSSHIEFDAVQDQHYLIRVGGWSGSSSGSGFLRVDGPGDPCDADPAAVEFGYPDGIPSPIPPSTPTQLSFSVTAGDEEPVSDSVEVRLTVDGNETSLPVGYDGDSLYNATIPALDCDQEVSFYLYAMGDAGGEASDPAGAPDDQHEIAVGVLAEVELLDEHFAAGIPDDWTASGLWHASKVCTPGGSCDGGNSAYFGVDGQCTYDTGQAESGSLQTAPIPIDEVVGDLVLTYCSALETEDFSPYDSALVFVNGELVDEAEQSGDWEERTVLLEGVIGDTMVIEFVFDTGDSIQNDHRGWHVDGVNVTATSWDCDPADSCEGDVNGDAVVDVIDLLAVIGDWGSTGSDADVNGDGIVNVADILAVMAAWGDCP